MLRLKAIVSIIQTVYYVYRLFLQIWPNSYNKPHKYSLYWENITSTEDHFIDLEFGSGLNCQFLSFVKYFPLHKSPS